MLELVRAGTDPLPSASAPPPKPAATPPDELAKLQGKWWVVRQSAADQTRTPVGGRLVIAGDVATREDRPDGQPERFRLALDPTRSPKRIELTALPGGKPSADDGRTFRGVYKLDGATLTLCVRDPESVERFGRPTEFVTGGGSLVTVLERADGLGSLQGDWKLVGGEPTDTARVVEDVIWFRLPAAEGAPRKMLLAVRHDAPGEIDLTPIREAGAGGPPLPGRYELTRDRFTLALPKIGFPVPPNRPLERPTGVAPGPDVTVLVFERDAPGGKLVGEWQRPVRGEKPDDTLMVWTFRDTGVCRIDYLDTATGRVNVEVFAGSPGVGRWRLDGGELVVETEAWVGDKRLPHRHVERLPVESLTADKLVVRRLPDPRTTRWVTEAYTRFAGWDKQP